MSMNKAKSDGIVITVREGVCMGSTPKRRDEDKTHILTGAELG
jgi:hypothetical protein